MSLHNTYDWHCSLKSAEMMHDVPLDICNIYICTEHPSYEYSWSKWSAKRLTILQGICYSRKYGILRGLYISPKIKFQPPSPVSRTIFFPTFTIHKPAPVPPLLLALLHFFYCFIHFSLIIHFSSDFFPIPLLLVPLFIFFSL